MKMHWLDSLDWPDWLEGKNKWFEIVLPVLLGLFLWVALTFILYSGTPSGSLAGRAEGFLIERTLKATEWGLEDQGDIVVLTIKEVEEEEASASSSSSASPFSQVQKTYAKVMERVLKDEPLFMMVDPLSSPYFADDERFIKKLTSLRLSGAEKVSFLYHPTLEQYLAFRLSSHFTMRQFDSCGEGVAGACALGTEKITAIEQLASYYWGEGFEGAPKFHISENLPYQGPHFLLHLPSLSSIKQISAKDVMKKPPGFFKGKRVFLGSDLMALEGGATKRVTEAHSALKEDGIPYHVFLAQVAHMFAMQKTIGVPPALVTWTLLFLLCALIFALLWRIGALAALGIFLIYSMLYPFANDFGVMLFHVYIPMFDFVFGGFLTFLISSYGLLSLRAFNRWRLDAREKSLLEVSELRKNFISLVSHDLNTPLAKMVGLMDILWVDPLVKPILPELTPLRRDMARLQLCMRAVLMSARIEAGSLSQEAISLINLKEDFDDRAAPVVDKLGIFYELKLASEQEESVMTPFHIDSRICCYVIACLLSLFGYEKGKKIAVLLHFKHLEVENEGQNPYQLTIKVESPTNLNKRVKNLLFNPHHEDLEPLKEDSFVEVSCARLIQTFKNHYSGSMSFTESAKNQRMTVTLFPQA